LGLLLAARGVSAKDAAGSTDASSAPRSTTLPAHAPQPAAAPELAALVEEVRSLEDQVNSLHHRLQETEANAESARAEVRELGRQLELTRAQLSLSPAAAPGPTPGSTPILAASAMPAILAAPGAPAAPAAGDAPQQGSMEERLSRLEENQQFLDDKLGEQYQSKLESGSKYRVRLSGLVVLNLFANRGNVDNLDIPQVATEKGLLDSNGTFGGSLRQSQIGLEVFGPSILGARTSADVRFDFAGGFPAADNGSMMGIVRLRTGTVRFDWGDTSIVAGQDSLFFAPLAPTSIATLAVPALAYSGNLWSWTPQVRVEHRINFSDHSNLSIQAGILDNWTGDTPPDPFYRYPTWGEESAQPAYATRLAWDDRLFGQRFAVGIGGYYSRQYWGLGRHVDGWAGTTDLTLPLGKYFQFTGEFYRGRATAGLGGGIGQDVVVIGNFISPTGLIHGEQSEGGWAQLKFKPRPKFEINGAFGQDNPFANQFRAVSPTSPNYDTLLDRNRSGFINFIYQPRSDVMLSMEMRHIRSFAVDGDSYTANQVSLTVGYIF
jgi:hypothetical protein